MKVIRSLLFLVILVGISATEAAADPITLRFSGVSLSVYGEFSNGVRVAPGDEEFAPLFAGGQTIVISVDYDTSQPDVDPSPNTGTYKIGRLSVAIPQLGIAASRSGNNIQISAFNDTSPGNDQFFAYVDGFDSFSSNVGLPGPSAFSHLVFGPGSMLANDSLPNSDLSWTFGNFSFNFTASDGTNRQVLLNYLPAPLSQPPSITSLTATPNVLWPPNHKMVSVSLHVAATGDPVPTCQISSVLSNEGGTVPGEMEWVVTGPLTVDLRADRAGHGSGRVYAITVTCTNSAANASRTVMVNVPHDRRR